MLTHEDGDLVSLCAFICLGISNVSILDDSSVQVASLGTNEGHQPAREEEMAIGKCVFLTLTFHGLSFQST